MDPDKSSTIQVPPGRWVATCIFSKPLRWATYSTPRCCSNWCHSQEVVRSWSLYRLLIICDDFFSAAGKILRRELRDRAKEELAGRDPHDDYVNAKLWESPRRYSNLELYKLLFAKRNTADGYAKIPWFAFTICIYLFSDLVPISNSNTRKFVLLGRGGLREPPRVNNCLEHRQRIVILLWCQIWHQTRMNIRLSYLKFDWNV